LISSGSSPSCSVLAVGAICCNIFNTSGVILPPPTTSFRPDVFSLSSSERYSSSRNSLSSSVAFTSFYNQPKSPGDSNSSFNRSSTQLFRSKFLFPLFFTNTRNSFFHFSFPKFRRNASFLSLILQHPRRFRPLS
jgi:hypothetical protein